MKRGWLLLVVVVVALLVAWTACEPEPVDQQVAAARDEPVAEATEDDVVRSERRPRAPPVAADEATEAQARTDDEGGSTDAPEVRTFVEPEGQVIDWPRERVRGRLVHPDGTPVSKRWYEVRVITSLSSTADVEAGIAAGTLESRTHTEHADRMGRFEAEVLRGRPVHVQVIDPQWLRSGPPGGDLVASEWYDEVPEAWTVTVRDRVAGRVLSEAGDPVAGATVRLFADGPLPGAQARTNDDGEFRVPLPGYSVLPGLPYPVFRLQAESADGGRVGWAPVRHDEPAEIVLLPPERFSGVVVDAATSLPIERAKLRAEPARGTPSTSDAAGRFELMLPTRPGDRVRHLRIDADGYLPTRAAVFEGRGRPGEPPIEFRLHRGNTLRVRLVDPSGAPVAGAHVRLEAYSRVDYSPVGGVVTARSGANGEVELAPVVPLVEDAEVLIRIDGVPRLERTVSTGASGIVTDLGTWTVGSDVSIRGRVLLADGTPAVGWAVGAARTGPSSDLELSDRLTGHGGGLGGATDGEGRFELRGITPGLWSLAARSPGRPMAHLRALSVGASGVEIVLQAPPAAPLLGRLVEADGTPRAHAELDVYLDHPIDLRIEETITTDEHGRFRYDGVGTDTDRVWVETRLELDVEGDIPFGGAYLRPGEETELRIDALRPFDPAEHRRIRGR